MKIDKKSFSIVEVRSKLEHFCAYQERCHYEVEQKLFDFQLSTSEREAILIYLIENNYINEERFASIYTQSKLHQKKWGKVRIKLELKARKISDYLINQSLKEISEEEYHHTFETVSEKHWDTLLERNAMKKRKKFCDYLLRKGWESDLVYSKVKQLEN